MRMRSLSVHLRHEFSIWFTCYVYADQYNHGKFTKFLATFSEPFTKEGTLFAKGYPRIWDESREKRVKGYPEPA